MNDVVTEFFAFLWALLTFDWLKNRTYTPTGDELIALQDQSLDNIVSSWEYPCRWCEDTVYRNYVRGDGPLIWRHVSTNETVMQPGPTTWVNTVHSAEPVFDSAQSIEIEDNLADEAGHSLVTVGRGPRPKG